MRQVRVHLIQTARSKPGSFLMGTMRELSWWSEFVCIEEAPDTCLCLGAHYRPTILNFNQPLPMILI